MVKGEKNYSEIKQEIDNCRNTNKRIICEVLGINEGNWSKYEEDGTMEGDWEFQDDHSVINYQNSKLLSYLEEDKGKTAQIAFVKEEFEHVHTKKRKIICKIEVVYYNDTYRIKVIQTKLIFMPL